MDRKKLCTVGIISLIGAASIGCGTVSSHDGSEVAFIGIGTYKEGKRISQTGWGVKSDGSASHPRFGAFDSHAPSSSSGSGVSPAVR